MKEQNNNKGMSSVLIVGILSCSAVVIVAIMKDKPIVASFGGASGIGFSVGAKVISGGKIG